MKKVITCLAILLASFSTSLFSLEWGGLINNGTLVKTPDFKDVSINQGNELYLWANTPLNKNETINFAAEGMYRFSFDSRLRDTSSKGITNALDLNLLKISGTWSFGSDNLFIDFGRFKYSDKAGAYFMQKSDGLNLIYNTNNYKLGFYAGYTGLQNQHTTIMQKDMIGMKEKNIIYDLAYSYIPIMADATLKNIGPLSTLGLQAAYFIDLPEIKQSRAYCSILLNGPISNIGSYNANFVLGTNNFYDLMLFGSADFKFSINNIMLLVVGTEYASGKNGKLNIFLPITARSVGNGNEIGSHVIAPHVSALFMLGEALLTLNGKFTTSVLNEKFEFNSLDSNIGIVFNVFSDLQLGVTANASVNFKEKAYNNFGMMVNASLSF